MRISDWSSDVCSSGRGQHSQGWPGGRDRRDIASDACVVHAPARFVHVDRVRPVTEAQPGAPHGPWREVAPAASLPARRSGGPAALLVLAAGSARTGIVAPDLLHAPRSEAQRSELTSTMRLS